MKMKVLIGLLLVFLIIGTASTVVAKELKVPEGYVKGDYDGVFVSTIDDDQYIYVGYMEVNNDIFNNSTDYTVRGIGENLYTFEDTEFGSYGIQEKVTVNGTDYLVSITRHSPLTDKQLSMLKDDIKSFNLLNDVKAMPV